MWLLPMESSETEDVMILHFKSTTSSDDRWMEYELGFTNLLVLVLEGF